MIMFWAVVALVCLAVGSATAADLPHQIFILVDDWGTGYPSWYRDNPLKLIHPEFDALKEEAVVMDRAYTYRFCSPSRASLLTGRAGWRHVAAIDNLIPWTTPDCIDREYSMWPAVLKTKGYYSSHIGKWHQGLYDTNCLAKARGFDEDYGFISGGEDHVTQDCFNTASCKCRDLWNNTVPSDEPEGTYNTDRFTDYAVATIKRHAAERPNTPLAMYLALQVTHAPVEAPADVVALYNFSTELQSTFHAMVTEASRATGAVTNALKDAGLWQNSIVWLFGDNGSPIQVAGSNAELRGGKGTVWEGGVAVPGMVTGGVLPPSQRGTRKSGLFHFSDVYATMLAMAGVNASDTPGPAPMDGFNQWPYISGATDTSPRSGMVHDHWLVNESTKQNPYNSSGGSIAETIDGKLYKLITVPGIYASWYGWFSPNATCQDKKAHDCFNVTLDCSPDSPCLYDLDADPTERVNIASTAPAGVLDTMLSLMGELDDTYHPPQPSPPNATGYCTAIAESGGFMSPWVSNGQPLW